MPDQHDLSVGDQFQGGEHALPFWKPLTPEMRAVVLVAQALAKYAPQRRLRRRAHPYEFIPIAREVVATLLLLPEGQALVREVQASQIDRTTDRGRSDG